MEFELRELDIVGLTARPCEGLAINYPLKFNNFVITLNNDDNMIIN